MLERHAKREAPAIRVPGLPGDRLTSPVEGKHWNAAANDIAEVTKALHELMGLPRPFCVLALLGNQSLGVFERPVSCRRLAEALTDLSRTVSPTDMGIPSAVVSAAR